MGTLGRVFPSGGKREGSSWKHSLAESGTAMATGDRQSSTTTNWLLHSAHTAWAT